MTPEIKRKQEESIDDYLIRLGENLESFNINWTVASGLLNLECEDEYSESKWRKDYASYLRWKTRLLKEIVDSDEFLQEIEDKTVRFQKERFKFQDQKREYTNILRQQARFEHLKDEIHKSILDLQKLKPLEYLKNTYSSKPNKKAVLLLSDWHYGADFKNSLNEYNPHMFRERFSKVLPKVKYYAQKHDVTELVIGNLGDQINGLIHVSTRVQSSEDVIKQTQVFAEAFAEMISELSGTFNTVKVINICGNHARTISNKNESVLNENFEKLIPWYLESRLSGFSNVEICTDSDGYFEQIVDGCECLFVHGDLDQVSSVAKTIPQMLGKVFKYIFCGHIHHDHVKEHGITKVISNGSGMGCDDYAMSKRFYAEPMQKFLVFNEDGIEGTFEIKF